MTVRYDDAAAPDELRDLVAGARRIAVLTGAGMSAESGVPTFRDVTTGLWAKYDPMTLATPEAFAEEPELVWAWYLRRAQMIAAVEPNAGHRALAALERHARVDVITQNVDDLHERAGSTRINHLHGSITAFRCATCGRPYDGAVAVPTADDASQERVTPPACPCGGLVRPGIVWFGEVLPEGAFDQAVDDALEADLMLVVGTSGVVHPAAAIPDYARGGGVTVVEINPEETVLTDRVDASWRTTAAAGLPQLVP